MCVSSEGCSQRGVHAAASMDPEKLSVELDRSCLLGIGLRMHTTAADAAWWPLPAAGGILSLRKQFFSAPSGMHDVKQGRGECSRCLAGCVRVCCSL